MQAITTADFRAAKKAVRVAGTADSSKASRVAYETLAARCPNATSTLLADMAWQVVLCAR